MLFRSSDESEDLTADTISIRGRGNSTWNFEKKPYRLKLNKKNNLLNLPAKAKNWVMLANHADKTLIRNAVALKIGSMLNLEFTPAFRFIDVYINNQYQGNYLLTDQVEVDKNRVAVDKQEATMTELPDISGGYLLEIDGFAASEPVWFTTSQGLKVTVKYPKDDEINSAQIGRAHV